MRIQKQKNSTKKQSMKQVCEMKHLLNIRIKFDNRYISLLIKLKMQRKQGFFHAQKYIIKTMQGPQLGRVQINNIEYKLRSVIGEGGAGVVYNATNDFQQQYAIKMIKNYTKDKLLRQSVDCQIKIQKMFKGEKYIINYYGETIVGKNIYFLIELGQFSLRNRIEMKNLVQGEYLQMLVDVARGLMFIHEKKILHRDIKPENVIYSKGVYKITDFGTSILQQTTNEIAGTVVYWAPELLFDQQEQFTQAVDIWSFGVMAFEAYFLIHPFFYNEKAQTSHQAINQIKENIEALTPNFTIGKLIMRLKSKGLRQKAQFIDKKLQQTHESLVELFKSFFARKPSHRLETGMLLATLQSIQQDQISRVQVRTSKLMSIDPLPSDVAFFIHALNLSYKLNHDYYYENEKEVEKYFQLGLRLLALKHYQGKDFIEYHSKDYIIKIVEAKSELQDKVKDALSRYFFYLCETKELDCYEEISILRTLVCMCTYWDVIRDKWKQFLKKIILITNIKMESMNEFQQLLLASPTPFTERQLASIENLVLSQYMG